MSNKGKVNFHIRHIKLWDKLADNPKADWEDKAKFIQNILSIEHNCYPCEVHLRTGKCPIAECQPEHFFPCFSDYLEWSKIRYIAHLGDLRRKIYLAKKIRDMEWEGPKMFEV